MKVEYTGKPTYDNDGNGGLSEWSYLCLGDLDDCLDFYQMINDLITTVKGNKWVWLDDKDMPRLKVTIEVLE